jgi:hypothetical protein
MVDQNPPRKNGENGPSIFVDGKEKVSLWIEAYAGDVLSVGEWEGVAEASAIALV